MNIKHLFNRVMADLKGVSHEEYLSNKKEKLQKELEELPKANNYLSIALEYYSFKSIKRTFEVLIYTFGFSLCVYIICDHFGFDFIKTIGLFWLIQIGTSLVGLSLRLKYK